MGKNMEEENIDGQITEDMKAIIKMILNRDMGNYLIVMVLQATKAIGLMIFQMELEQVL